MYTIDERVTAMIFTSPVPSNPSTEMIEETIDSVKHHMPKAKLLVMMDGVRPEQEYLKEAYKEFRGKILTKTLDKFGGTTTIYPVAKHVHQIGLMRLGLPMVATPYLLFMEHDTPLVTDETIPWIHIDELLGVGSVNLVRFLPEKQIHPEHEYLMLERVGDYTKTIQFSARPHLATKKFYEKVVTEFSLDANCFIEDKMHSICQQEEWEDWRMVIYTPQGNAKRSYHTDGRAGGPKFDESQVF